MRILLETDPCDLLRLLDGVVALNEEEFEDDEEDLP